MRETKFTAKKNVLTITRTFDAPVNLVWKTWTEAELLDQWWAPKPWSSQTTSMEFKEGGHRIYAMVSPEGEKHWSKTSYLRIVSQIFFSGEDAFCDHEGIINDSLPVGKFENQFNDEKDTTTVIITTKYASEEHLQQVINMGMKEGFSMICNNLDELLVKLKS